MTIDSIVEFTRLSQKEQAYHHRAGAELPEPVPIYIYGFRMDLLENQCKSSLEL
jgi:hypothetical protein